MLTKNSSLTDDEYNVVKMLLNIDFLKNFIMASTGVSEDKADIMIRGMLGSPKLKNDLMLPCRFCERKVAVSDVVDHSCNKLDIIMKIHTDGNRSAEKLIIENKNLIPKRFPLNKKDLGEKIYRGLCFKNKKALLDFLSEISLNEIKTRKHSSWTFDYYVAEGFALFKKESNIEGDRSLSLINGYRSNYGIIVSTILKSEKNVLAKIDHDFGMYDEQELILKPGLYPISIEKIYSD